MGTIHEEVRAKNINTIRLLIEFLSSLGNKYIPLSNELTVVELSKKCDAFEKAFNEECISKGNTDSNVDIRRSILKDDYKNFLTKISASLVINPIAEAALDRFKKLKKEINGARLTESKVDVSRQHSTSHCSFENKTALFESIIVLLENNNYKAISDDINIESLKDFVEIQKNANSKAALSKQKYSDNKNITNEYHSLFEEKLKRIKSSIKGTFGDKSYEYETVIKFTI